MCHESGSVLVVVLGWVMIVSLIMTGVLAMTREQSLLLHAYRNHQRAFYQAEQGLRCARSAVVNQQLPNCSSLPHVTISVDSESNERAALGYRLRSEANIGYSKVLLEAFGTVNDHHEWVQYWWRIAH